MSGGARDLWRLQEIDSRIAALRAEIDGADARIRRDPELERAREDALAAERDRREREERATVAEAEMNALQARVKNLDRRLYGGSVHNPQELMEMQRELEALRGRAQESEDRAIALLEEAETSAADERSRVAGLRSEEARRAAALEPLRARAAALTEQLAQVTGEREGIAASLEPSALALYARVAQQRQPAVVGLAGDGCGGCHLPLSNEERRLVRAGAEIVQCSNCDRILVP